MSKTIYLALAATLLAGAAQAHEVWLERDGAGPVRVYLGEPADAVPPNGDPEFSKLKAPAVFAADPATTATLTRKTDHIEAAVAAAGDVRARDADVFAPWKSGETYSGVIYYARAGRSDPRAVLDLEIAPTAPGADTFVVTYKGQPAAKAKVTVISPEKWSKTFETDETGKVSVPVSASGRYLLGVSKTVKEAATLSGREVASVSHISTTTFVK